jgi:acyl-CoA synthetase (AMP-forming)/AMP-acid ligase II
MLYELWRTVAAQRRNEPALCDLASGRQLTFGDLFAAGEAIRVGANNFVFPRGQSAEFILAVLAAWRTGKIVCPVEQGQEPPVSGGTSVPASRLVGSLAPPIIHLKVTSATTGTARLVAFTAKQLAADAENIVATMGFRPDWPNLGVISLAHSYGFSNLVTPLLLHGIPLILAPSPLPEAIRRAAQGEPELTLPAVPAMWRAWHDADAIPSNVKLAISAGAPLPLALEQEAFAKHGLKIHNFYGASECGGIAYDASAAPRTDAACVGSPMKNVSLSVAQDGCMEVRSRAVAERYWWGEAADLARQCASTAGEPAGRATPCAPSMASAGSEVPALPGTLGNGCFHTSDLAEISNGLVYLRGRAGDQINVAGRKVSPETIERVMLEHDAVNGCLVFGVPSVELDRGETIVACVVAKPSTRTEVLRQFALVRLPAWQVPREWWFVDSLAENQRGKISRAEWRQRFEQRRERSERPVTLDKADESS